jgi:hypothetical protein
LTCDFFLHKSQYVSTSKLCMSIDFAFFFVRVFAYQKWKSYKNLSNIHNRILFAGFLS